MELYRCVIDDCEIDCCRTLNVNAFIVETEMFEEKKKGKRECLKTTIISQINNLIRSDF